MVGSDILIAVIGVTGAGKTSFVAQASGRQDLETSHDIESCAQSVVPVKCTIDGQVVTLIDTPGFDDSRRNEVQILKLVATYLSLTHGAGKRLTGIVFVQPMEAARLTGSELLRTTVFRKLLGADAYRRVVIAPTMWEHLGEAAAAARQEQRVRREDVWGHMVAQGAVVMRHSDNALSAAAIVRHLVAFADGGRHAEPQIQRERAANGGNLAETAAGRRLDFELGEAKIAELRREHLARADEINKLRAEVDMLYEEREDLQRMCWQLS
ncbi:hypothetical protein B0T24DRAFT_97612 [Lasiosphaeria ovina]|uniref:G domain-containing protein n=1 Tax=Lasiosphaeria ovina TaxID=92902 RepID=A0AAE0MYS1_9PEZI|nr:hypothetical protein B0T24DRAFT_97612 [Lasiosphaeria ovina]